ncbi:hypothetical protein [Rhizorhapis sp. SPR117]|uniref:hypothetical protein n=1 Tax=Rhizorhapis sp. SPR117 TaxID=2912611 RepID=UPI001F1E15A1|nr:hypothetical protein [Rhizorhapis sp. SPR117]
MFPVSTNGCEFRGDRAHHSDEESVDAPGAREIAMIQGCRSFEAAQRAGVAREMVRLFERSGLGWALPPEMTDTVLEARLYDRLL